MYILKKYGTATTILFPLVDAGTNDYESTPVTFASGDTQISKDEGAFANCTNNPAHEGNGIYSLTLTATEMQAATVVITIIDSATKAWEDQSLIIDTYGNASAEHAADLDDSVRLGLTALPNAAADAAGGLPISDAGGLDLDAMNTNVNDIETDTAEIGTAGAGLTNVPWNASWDAEVQSEVDDALVAFFTSAAQLVDDIWDEVLSKAAHDVAQSAGKRLRQVDAAFEVHSGTAAAGTANTITLDAGADGTNDNIYRGDRIVIVGGTGIGEHGICVSYASSTKQATMSENWVVTPDNTSEFVIVPADVDIESWQHIAVSNGATSNLPAVDSQAISDNTTAADNVQANIGNLDTALSGMDTKLDDIQGATFDTSTDSLEALRNRGDAAWTTGAGGTPPQLLQNTTIATLASQTSFTLTAGSADDDAYNGAVVVVTDQSTSTQKAVGSVSDYTGSTKTVTLTSDPGIFTMAVGDTVDVIANASTAPTAAAVADAVWDEAISGHTTTGSTGRALQLAGVIISETTAGGTPTTTTLQLASGSATDDFYNDMIIIPTSGSLAGQARVITDYDGGTTTVTIDEAWTSAPSNGDSVLIRATHTHSINQIVDGVWDEALSGHSSAGTAGKAVADIETDATAILADTNELQTDDIPGTLSTISTNLATVDTVVDSILVDTTAIEVDTQDIQSRLPAALVGGRMDSDVEAINNDTDAADKLAASALGVVSTTVNDASATTTSFVTALTEATNDHYNGRIIIFTSGALANQATDITDYDGASKTVTVTALTEAPANGVSFVIV